MCTVLASHCIPARGNALCGCQVQAQHSWGQSVAKTGLFLPAHWQCDHTEDSHRPPNFHTHVHIPRFASTHLATSVRPPLVMRRSKGGAGSTLDSQVPPKVRVMGFQAVSGYRGGGGVRGSVLSRRLIVAPIAARCRCPRRNPAILPAKLPCLGIQPAGLFSSDLLSHLWTALDLHSSDVAGSGHT